MNIPFYLWLFLAAVVILSVLCALYFYLYKRRINAALHTPDRPRPLPAPFHVAAILAVLLLVLSVVLSFLAGFGVAYRTMDDPEGEIDVTAFYAQVAEVGGETLVVEGLPVNRPEFRSTQTLQLYPELPVLRNGQIVDATQLQPGDSVCIILLTDVTGIEEIFKIEVLN